MTASTAGMVAITVALTIFAGPLYDVCTRIGDCAARAGHARAAAGAARRQHRRHRERCSRDAPDLRRATAATSAARSYGLAPAAVLRVARRALDAAVGPVHLAGVPHRPGRGGRRDARVPAATRRAVGPREPLVRLRLRPRVPRRARARLAHRRVAGARLPPAARRGDHRGAAADRRRPDHDAHGGHGIPHSRLAHRRRRSRPPHPVPARHRRAQRARRRAAARERAAAGSAASCGPSARARRSSA